MSLDLPEATVFHPADFLILFQFFNHVLSNTEYYSKQFLLTFSTLNTIKIHYM